jgi:hypothetical protein
MLFLIDRLLLSDTPEFPQRPQGKPDDKPLQQWSMVGDGGSRDEPLPERMKIVNGSDR